MKTFVTLGLLTLLLAHSLGWSLAVLCNGRKGVAEEWDFTEARLALKLDPGKELLKQTAVLESIRENLRPGQRVFLGVTDVLDPRIESPGEVRDLLVEAARYIPLDQLGSTDDCGFSPFADDVSTAREIAFEKIRARVEGTRLAGNVL